MKIAYKWLQEYIKTGLSPEELGEQFRLTSSEVEEIVNWNDRFSHLVIGHVESVAQHPRSDHLFLTQTRVGPNQVKSIVCGAPNVAAGQTVVVALPGATVIGHDGESHQIEETVIRGEQSEGMLCAADEIGLPEPEGEQGILVLSEKVPAGTPAAEALHLDDTVLDLEITPNRPDLLSYRGLARELATIEKKRLPEVPIYTYEPAHERQVNPIHISIEDSKLCSRYSAICLKNVTVQPSPQWMQSRLTLSGIRPINTVVDVTNYVMLELGQPLHAFDLDLLTTEPHPALKVRAAKAKERITLIGEKEKALAAGDIVIAGGKDQPIALAGIMGNASTGISQTTTRVLLESAVFSGPQIRRASRRLGIRTEASTRFEKGLDPEQTVTALKRAIYLLQEISTAELESG
ncbi:phenylalanine--tRNA ligase subunit beta, partial [Patescibacteria group bacterium]|nr:phenylalanine--tRNA ligase subunit beta [Patescibacteria group bacterium]